MGGAPVASKLGCTVETLRRWVRQAERDQENRPGVTTDEHQRLEDLGRENFELKRANEILRKASASFAQAELDRRSGRSCLDAGHYGGLQTAGPYCARAPQSAQSP